jgi:DNA-binding phage protein
MPLTRDFKETVKARAAHDAAFRAALLSEAVELLLADDVAIGRNVLRDYINATIGFEDLAAKIGKPVKSVMRMFGPNGNPTAQNLFAVISQLQKATGVSLAVRAA